MGTIRRFVDDESGMTLALAMIMIVLIGVMGAGLLTFASTDLNTVTEENRGQRAFEVADAGIQAAKRQLAADVVRGNYDDVINPSPNPPTVVVPEDIQWSKSKGGLTLTNLDGDFTTSDSVNVTIQYRGSTTDDFRVISTGTYGDPPKQTKRRIEAIFTGVQAGAGAGETIGHPVYYTNTNIKIMSDGEKSHQVTLTQVSLFTRGDILIQDFPSGTLISKAAFTDDIEDKGNPDSNSIKTSGNDELCDWNSKVPAGPTCFKNGTQGTWNTQSRPDELPGMAAEGRICSFADTSRNVCPSTSIPDNPSTTSVNEGSYLIADGKHGFDMTTSPMFEVKPCHLQVSTPTSCPDTVSGKMSYPFPLPKPIPAGLKAAACDSTEVSQDNCPPSPPTVSYFEGNPPNATWGLGTSDAYDSKVAFIDAQNQTLTFNPGSGFHKGILVVWCGRLLMQDDFEGIILNLVGSNLPGNAQCNKDTATQDGLSSVGTYENQGHKCQCWVYAEGGTSAVPGIQIDSRSTVQFRPSEDWSFQDGLFVGPPPTNFKLQGWRELYQASP